MHVPAGKTRTVKIKLSHAGMRALRRAGKLKVTVTLVITSPGEKTVKKTFRVTLKAAKARKRHRN